MSNIITFVHFRDRDGKDPEVMKIYGQVVFLVSWFVNKQQSNRHERTLDAVSLNLTSKYLGQ